MGVAECQPKAAMPGRPADDRQHVGETGARAAPGLGIETGAERHDLPCDLFRPIELPGIRWRVAARELDPGGQANSALHPAQHEPGLRIAERVLRRRFVHGLVVHVVAALESERETIAETLAEIA